MKDSHARALAITALVFMAIFVGSLIATLVDSELLYGSIGYVALCSGVFVFMCFLALKADGRGYSISRMKNDEEWQEIEKALDEKEREEAEKTKTSQPDEPQKESGAAQPKEDAAAPEQPDNEDK